MASFIGPFTFRTWKGLLVEATPEYTIFEQAGVNGRGVVFGGYKYDPITITTMDGRFASDSAAATTQDGYAALAKTAVTVSDPLGHTWNNTLVLSVQSTISFDPLGYILTASWTLMQSA